MKFYPRLYQLQCIEEIRRSKSKGLILDMGLGKTAIMLTAAADLPKPMLVIAPLQVAKTVWKEERDRWDHLQGITLSHVLGPAKARIQALSQKADVYVINRENVPWLVKYMKRSWPFPTVVVDELSSFKNRGAERFKALRAVRSKIERFYGLTGTPAPNGLLDLWPQLWLIDQGASLGRTLTGYRNAYFVPEKIGPNGVVYSWRLRPGAAEAIYARLRSSCLVIDPAGLVDIPPVTYIDRMVELSGPSMETYQRLQKEYILAEADVVAGSAAILITKLLQLAGGAVYNTEREVVQVHTEKMAALVELVEEANGQSVLIFYSFRHELDRLHEAFPEAVELKGNVEAWNRGEIKIALAHPASTGHGLNLQFGGHIAIWYGLPCSLELYQQANKRLHRPGQVNPVRIYHLLAKGTRDSWVLRYVLAPKEEQQRLLLEALA